MTPTDVFMCVTHRATPFTATPEPCAAAHLSSFEFKTLLVDPPRAGLDSDTLGLAKGFARILYISCNPKSLIENMAELNKTHSIEALAFFDQFPYTEHLESGVILKRRPI